MVDTYLPVVPQEGEQEQCHRGSQPEQQVQDKSQPSKPQAPPDGAHPVVNQAQRGPKQEALPENDRLTHDVHVHGQRRNREKNPPRPPTSSS